MTHQTHLKNQQSDFTAKEFFMGLLRNWLLIIAFITLALVGTLLFYMGYSPSYTSTARILLEDRASQLTSLSSINASSQQAQQADGVRIVSDQVQYLKSLDLAKGVDKLVHFKRIAEFSEAETEDNIDVYKYFASKLKVTVPENSNVIDVSYTARDAKLAARIVNVITQVYKNSKANQGSASINEASNWLSVKVGELQNKQRIVDAKVVDYRINNGIFEGQNNQKLLSQQLTALNASIVTATGQRAETEARADLIGKLLERNGNLDSARDVLNSATIQQYRSQALTLQRRVAELSETLLPSHPRLMSVNAELNNANDQIRAEARNIMLSLRNEVEISRQRENALKGELNGLKNSEAGSLVQEVELNALKREATANRTLLDSYLAKLREAEVRNNTGLDASKIHVISTATSSMKPSSIGRSAIFAVMGVVGLLIGIVVATLRTLSRHGKQPSATAAKTGKNARKLGRSNKLTGSKMDGMQQKTQRKKRSSHVVKHVPQGNIAFDDLAFMAAIPLTTKSNRQSNLLKNDILAHLDTEYADGFVDLVDNLMAQSDSEFQKHFMISGIEDDEESYEALLNLARILDMKGAKVLIMDLDADSQIFSRSVVDNVNFGFSDVIIGQAYFEDCTIKDNKSGTDILLAGANINDLDDVIISAEMNEFLDDLDQIYDVILIHSNDVRQQHVTTFIDGQVDLTLLVADWEDRATAQLESALVALKDFQSSEFGLLLLSTDMAEFKQEVG